MTRSTALAILFALLLLFPARPASAADPAASRPGSPDPALVPAPVEFRGLPFGISLETAATMVGGLEPVAPLAPGNKDRFKDVYYRPDEDMRFGSAEILSVGYVFPDDHLRQVIVTLSGETNVFLIKERLIQSFGPGRQAGVRYGWTWPNFSVVLASDPEGGLSSLIYTLER